MNEGADVDILISPGIPGLGHEELADGTGGYPTTTADMIKLLQEQGIIAAYDRPREQRSELMHQAADIWLPILEVLKDVGVGVLGGCIFELVSSPSSHVHMKLGRRRNGATEWIEVDGKRDDVIKAVESFLSSKSDDA